MENFITAAAGLVGVAIAVFGILEVKRTRDRNLEPSRYQRALLEARLERLEADFQQYLASQVELSPEVRASLYHNLESILEDVYQQAGSSSQDVRHDIPASRRRGGPSDHVISGRQVVQVAREDGSTIDLRVDPTDADSVRNFLDDTRRSRGERVINVHASASA